MNLISIFEERGMEGLFLLKLIFWGAVMIGAIILLAVAHARSQDKGR